VGRGDRRLTSVVRRAWELGAGMDSWWESLERAYGAWTQAIEEAGLTWKYRQVEQGEWNIMDFGEAGHNTTSLDAPLPWDHLDTGIDKQWLKEDLQRALAAATVPDCSFEGCSHCGVCSVDFGHNVVIPSPGIPAIAGSFIPNQERMQRLRVWFGKLGDMALLSHLDLLRMFDRVVRRAQIPIAFTGGFHPSPRISPANALALGATSSGEIVDFELTRSLDPSTFQTLLTDCLPNTIPIYQVQEVDLKDPSATQAVHQSEYCLTFASSESGDDWQTWIDRILESTEIPFEQTTKNGNQKVINLRDRLFHLELLDSESVQVRYVGSCQNDGTILRPEHVTFMLETVAGKSIQLQHIHRDRLICDQG
jgi:radical SAM-linked protein